MENVSPHAEEEWKEWGGAGGKVAGVDPGFSEGGANSNAWPHGGRV